MNQKATAQKNKISFIMFLGLCNNKCKTMKTRFTLTIVLVFILGFSQAQTQDLGSMLTSIANGIKPEGFKSGWAKSKDKWLQDAASLSTTDLQKSAKQVGDLVKNLKDEAFSADAKGLKKDLLANLTNLDSVSKLGETLSSLVSGLNPDMLTNDFLAKKDTILGGLKMLQ
jgi:hypothetical protein